MKIPENEKYWELCASICLIRTVVDYLHIDIDQISNLKQIEQVLNDAQRFNLKEESIEELWKNNQYEKISIWNYLYNFLKNCNLWNFFFEHRQDGIYISSISYLELVSDQTIDNKPVFLARINSSDTPEILLEKNQRKYLLVSAFSDSDKILYYFKKNSWFSLGKREENKATFHPEMYLLYVQIEKRLIIEDINFAKQFSILNNKDFDWEYFISYVENFSYFWKEEIKNAQQIIESQTKDIERLSCRNQEQNSEIEILKSDITMLKNQLNEKEEAVKTLESTIKASEFKLNSQTQAYNLLLDQNKQLMQGNKNLQIKHREHAQNKLENFRRVMNQACDELSREIITDPYLLWTEKDQNLKLSDSSLSVNTYSHLNEAKTSTFSNIKLGIPNLGNTCYLNSVLQIFASTNKLYDLICSKNDSLSISLSKVLSAIRIGNLESSLKSLKSEIDATFPMFLNWDQQDAKELLVTLLDYHLDASTKSLFTFRYHEKLPCQHCKEESIIIREENLVIIPSSENNVTSFFQQIKKPKSIEGEGLKCDHCNYFSIFNTEIVDVEFPPYIILYLPKSKVEHQRAFNFLDETLELNGQIYYLYGVICYYKNESGGHYTALTRDGDSWTEYNDDHVENKSFDENAAYLAFYSVMS